MEKARSGFGEEKSRGWVGRNEEAVANRIEAFYVGAMPC